ncbi:TPA: dihydroorotase [Thermoplasmata archaeon]|nr:dihydroorotase [Thermoplasmata archaeon]
MERLSIGIEGGVISKVAKNIDGDAIYDFGSKLILPAAIDSHVHMRDPGAPHKEDFATGSLAALHGGVTCVLDMPNTSPPTITVDALKEKARIASAKSKVDFGLFAGVQPGIDVRSLATEAVGFKLYMAGTTGDLLVASLDVVMDELRAVAASGKVLAVHAEDECMRRKDSESSLVDHLRNRRNECETSALRKLRDLGIEGLRKHVCHVSASESLPLLSGATGMTTEVTPHHLLLDKDSKLGTFGKVNPPLRRREDRQALFKALKEGWFDTIASDHAPHTMEEKEEEFDFAPSGMPGVETTVPIMLQLVRDRHLALSNLVTRLCERPGEIFGIPKGKIEKGYDADLIVVDMMSGTEIRADRLHSKCGWTPYEGMSAVFPKVVFLRGDVMTEDGDLVGEPAGRDVVGKR